MIVPYKPLQWGLEKLAYHITASKSGVDLSTESRLQFLIGQYQHPEPPSRTHYVPPSIDDRVSLYKQIGGCYECGVEPAYMQKRMADCTAYLYLFAAASIRAYELWNAGERITNNAIRLAMEQERDSAKILYAAITVNAYDLALSFSEHCPLIHSMLIGDDRTAREIAEALPETPDESREVYYVEDVFLKPLYLAILERDETAFRRELLKRIRKYRNVPLGYLTSVDTVSISLIKFARKRGMKCRIHVIEIPEYYLNENLKIDPETCRLPEIPQKQKGVPHDPLHETESIPIP